MLEAKLAKMIRPSIFSKIFWIELPIVFSDLVKVGISALVLSERRQRTPSSPIFAILCKFAGSPTGVKSNLKSPVATILPEGVLTTTPKASGILWVVRKKLMDVLRKRITVSSLISCNSASRNKPCSSNLLVIKASANGPA